MNANNFREGAEAHTELNVFAAIVSILEGGHIYTNKSQATANKIIALCHKEQDRLLRVYDARRALIVKQLPVPPRVTKE